MNIKEAIARYFSLRRVAASNDQDNPILLDKRIEILKDILRLFNNRTDHSAILLYCIALQEAHITTTLDLVDEPYNRVIQFQKEKVAELLWKLQGTDASLIKLSTDIDLSPRDILLKARKVVTEEPHMSFGDWSLIRQASENILFSRSFQRNQVNGIGTLVVAILEENNGNPARTSARLELNGNRPKPNASLLSPIWKK